MSSERTYYVYIMASESRVLYIGITSDLERRVYEHKQRRIPGFTSRYKVTRLVWYETTNDVEEAIAFEKKLKLLTVPRRLRSLKNEIRIGEILARIGKGT